MLAHRTRIFATIAAFALAGSACDGDPRTPGGAPSPDATAPDAPVLVDAGVDVVRREAFKFDVVLRIADAPPAPDHPPPPEAGSLPAVVTPPRRLLGPDDRLAGDGASACSTPGLPGGSVDRWCAFHRTTGALAELWVIDVSRVMAGTPPACDGSDPGCRRLTSTLWTAAPLGGPSHPFSHQFSGDVLIYYADARSGRDELHRGPVYAWRPGWTGPRVLTSDAGVMCQGHDRLPLVHCLDTLLGDPNKPESFELRAGSLAEPPSQPLPSIGRIRPLAATGRAAWQVGWAPDGSFLAVSSPEPDPAVETLRVIPTAELGKPGASREILRDAGSWSIGHDSRRVYFVRGPETDLTLLAADAADGGNLVTIDRPVKDYLLLGRFPVDQGVSFLTGAVGRTSFRFVRDSRMPGDPVTVFSYRNFLEDVHMSADLRYTAWLDANFVGRVVRHADLATCRLNTHPEVAAFETLPMDNGALVFWSEDAFSGDGRRDGFLASSDCAGTRRYATGIGYYLPVGDRGLVYTDEADAGQRMTLKYAPFRLDAAGWTLDSPVRVHEKLDDGMFTALAGGPLTLLFRTSAADPGVWIFAPPL